MVKAFVKTCLKGQKGRFRVGFSGQRIEKDKRCVFLKRHIAVMARAQPRGFVGHAGIAVTGPDRRIDRCIPPGNRIARLTIMGGIKAALDIGRRNPKGEFNTKIGMFGL